MARAKAGAQSTTALPTTTWEWLGLPLVTLAVTLVVRLTTGPVTLPLKRAHTCDATIEDA